MAKEFDIYLNKRLTECDILVYSIPFRDGLTTMSRLILESCIESYTLQKFVAAQTGSHLISHIDDMLKICYERLNCGTNINISTDFQTHYVIAPSPNHIEIGTNEIRQMASLFTNVENSIRIATSSIYAGIAKSGGNGHSEVEIDAEVQNTLKRGIESASASVYIGAHPIETNAKYSIGADSDAVISAELSNLCYRFYNAASSIVQLSASIVGTEFHYSLGHGWSGICFGTNVSGVSEKYITIDNIISVLSSVIEAAQKFLVPSDSGIAIDAEAGSIIKRYRVLTEMDENTLSYYDNMTLDTIDYVIVDM